MHCNDTDVKKNTSNKEIFCTRIVLINVASDKCRHSIADKQAYMAYKLLKFVD